MPVSDIIFDKRFAINSKKDVLWALGNKIHQKRRCVIVREEIYHVIEQEHLLSGHSGQDTTWAFIRNIYYGIT